MLLIYRVKPTYNENVDISTLLKYVYDFENTI